MASEEVEAVALGMTKGVDMIGPGREHSDNPDRHPMLHRHGTAPGENVQLLDGAVVPGIPDVSAEPTHLASVTRLREIRRDDGEVRAYQAIEQAVTAIRLPRCRPDIGLLRQWLGARHRSVELVGERAVVLDRLTSAYLEPRPGDWLIDVPMSGVIALGDREFRALFQPATDMP